MDSTLKHHEEMIYEHDEDLCHIRRDLVDIKTRLGIKDLTNGQVKDYQRRLVKSLDDERKERKENDKFLREEIKSLDGKIWSILAGVILLVFLDLLKSVI